MARRKQPKLAISFTYKASALVREIWTWNAVERGERHADTYEALLYRHIAKLAHNPELGEAIEDFEDVRRLLIQRRASGYGHIAVYRIEGQTVQILLIYHTAHDWQNRIKREL